MDRDTRHVIESALSMINVAEELLRPGERHERGDYTTLVTAQAHDAWSGLADSKRSLEAHLANPPGPIEFDDFGNPIRISVNFVQYQRLLEALDGPAHHIREIQATRRIAELTPDPAHPNPINVLLKEYNDAVRAHNAAVATEKAKPRAA